MHEEELTVEDVKCGNCRICLKDGYIFIFGEPDISCEVREFGNIKLDVDDELPQYICDACKKLLDAAIIFRKTAINSDLILRNTDDSLVGREISSYKSDMDNLEDETSVKREYIEFSDSSYFEVDEDIIKYEHESDSGRSSRSAMLNSHGAMEDKDIEMQLLKLKEEDNNENEMVVIVVSEKNEEAENSNTESVQLKCQTCNIAFQSHEELEGHSIHEHQIILKKCDVCSKVVHKNEYKTHLKNHRDKYKATVKKKYAKVECEVCGKHVNKAYYNYHKKLHGSDSERAERVRECPICHKNVTVNYFTDHIRRAHSKKVDKYTDNALQAVIKCPVCDKNIKEKDYKSHLDRHNGAKKHYICDQCGKELKSYSSLQTHILTHGSELKYKCQFCPYRGLHLALLKVHVRTHTGDYNYKCTECPAKFITKSNLSKHLNIHKRAFKYNCEVCNKGFYTKRDVERHYLNIHSDRKEHVCETCGKTFGHRDTLLAHQLKSHNRKKLIDRKGRIPSYLKV